MNCRYATTRLSLLLALSLAATAASAANPPPNFSERINLCGISLHALVNITFGQTASTATVRATSQPVKVNPYIPYTPFQTYSIRAHAMVKKNAASDWTTYTETGSGTAGFTQTPVSSGASTFKDATCQIKGVVNIVTNCPPESGMPYDIKQIERTWVGCGV